ncbi:MAG: [FeFe] hydrogenase H-cluster radical SAM maturase HydE [Candidatus Omnitrophica bacterium]|nr:[FeFe] hydrogenase H-cluster radical SAM maturase HydE [Candidatus Omnitrophota bacterium]
MRRDEIIKQLKNPDTSELFREADRVRKEQVGDGVHLRGLIEFSNACVRDCLYCGLRRSNRDVKRYQMSIDEIFETVQTAQKLGYRSVVLQSGENCQYPTDAMCGLLSKIKKEFNLAVTLSIGEKTREEYAAFKAAGADRYLLRFETSAEKLFSKLKPDSSYGQRMLCLQWLRELGFQVGSGIMVGLPGQAEEMIADDILLMEKLDLDMIGIGPFIANPQTPLNDAPSGTLDLTLKTLALIRIVTKNTHLPATTAMGSMDPQGREKALQCGANVLMPNVTPTMYREHYQLYPNKICIKDKPGDCWMCISGMVRMLGRVVAEDPGHSLKFSSRLFRGSY